MLFANLHYCFVEFDNCDFFDIWVFAKMSSNLKVSSSNDEYVLVLLLLRNDGRTHVVSVGVSVFAGHLDFAVDC